MCIRDRPGGKYDYQGGSLSTMETEASLVGITTTIPVEVVFAAGVKPVDLNNAFVSHPARGELIERALAEGFPQNTCAWLKGIFGAVMEQGPRRVIGVVRGDCSGTGVLLEALEAWGVEITPFSFPFPPSREEMAVSYTHLRAHETRHDLVC